MSKRRNLNVEPKPLFLPFPFITPPLAALDSTKWNKTMCPDNVSAILNRTISKDILDPGFGKVK